MLLILSAAVGESDTLKAAHNANSGAFLPHFVGEIFKVLLVMLCKKTGHSYLIHLGTTLSSECKIRIYLLHSHTVNEAYCRGFGCCKSCIIIENVSICHHILAEV